MRLQRTERQTLLLLKETLVVLVETEEVREAKAVVVREADENVQDPEGTRTSKDLRPHPGNLMQQVVDATMTPPWTLGTVHPWGVTRGEDGMPES